jgi:hypothetical protein
MSTLRWWILLRAVDARIALGRALGLQMMGLFFNSLVPGNVGGDVLKNHAVLGNQGARLIVLALVERTIGVISLVWTSAIGLAFFAGFVKQNERLRMLAGLQLVIISGSIVVPIMLLHFLGNGPRRVHAAELAGTGTLFARLRSKARLLGAQALETIQLVRAAKLQVFLAFAVSILMHLGNAWYFFYLTRLLGNLGATYAQVLMAFPLGMTSVILPVSVSGLGVGHVFFDRLFSIIGLTGGATVFNVYMVAVLTPNLLGAIPYLFFRSRKNARYAPT